MGSRSREERGRNHLHGSALGSSSKIYELKPLTLRLRGDRLGHVLVCLRHVFHFYRTADLDLTIDLSS
jgi:hypothetical protein